MTWKLHKFLFSSRESHKKLFSYPENYKIKFSRVSSSKNWIWTLWNSQKWSFRDHVVITKNYLKSFNIVYLAAISIICNLYFVVSLVQEIHIYIISVAWTIYNFVPKVEEWQWTNTRDGSRPWLGPSFWEGSEPDFWRRAHAQVRSEPVFLESTWKSENFI